MMKKMFARIISLLLTAGMLASCATEKAATNSSDLEQQSSHGSELLSSVSETSVSSEAALDEENGASGQENIPQNEVTFENVYTPIPSDYDIVNNISDTCYAALYLDEMENPDYLFYLMYQTQSGYSAPDTPTGFSDASEISAEGLVRFFCAFNAFQLGAFSDPDKGLYYIPNSLMPMTLDKFFQGYRYDPKSLPPEYGDASVMVNVSYDVIRFDANPCRVEKAEILDPERLRLTATGLDRDGQTAVNIQELVLNIRKGGGLFFESYVIKPV